MSGRSRRPAVPGLVVATAALLLAIASDTAAAEPPATAEQAVARYLAARGGLERWRAVMTMKLTGQYAAFSERAPFTLLRRRPDRYRLDLTVLGNEAIRARDTDGVWWLNPTFGMTAPARLEEGPYAVQLSREALFEPPLFDHRVKGVEVTLIGPGDLDGQATVDLRVTLADGQQETWYLDAERYLELAIDSEVNDHSQGPHRMRQRTYFSDFRSVDGLVIPHHIEIEFGARLEVMDIEQVVLDPSLEPTALRMPAAPAAAEGSEDG